MPRTEHREKLTSEPKMIPQLTGESFEALHDVSKITNGHRRTLRIRGNAIAECCD